MKHLADITNNFEQPSPRNHTAYSDQTTYIATAMIWAIHQFLLSQNRPIGSLPVAKSLGGDTPT